MANIKEIQDRMNSVNDTLKITNAMYMISKAKMKKAKESLEDAEPYFMTLQHTISNILHHLPPMEHAYFHPHPEVVPEELKTVYVVITGDKGLAGAYNHNVLKAAEKALAGPGKHRILPVGQVGALKLAKLGLPMERGYEYIAQYPTMRNARAVAYRLLELYDGNEADEIHILYTRLINAAREDVMQEQLLPLIRERFNPDVNTKVNGISWARGDVTSEELKEQGNLALLPTENELVENMIPNFMIGYLYGALVESFSSEQNARVRAMESASRNGEEMLKELSLKYNQARQAAITQEITEVVSGAKAMRKKI